MGKEGKSLSVSWREQSEPLSLPSVIIYRYFFYRQWASCVQFLCACAKEPRYFPDRGIDRSTDCELTRAARPTPGKIARGATQLRGFDPGPAAGPGGGRRAGRGVARAMPHRVHRGRLTPRAQLWNQKSRNKKTAMTNALNKRRFNGAGKQGKSI